MSRLIFGMTITATIIIGLLTGGNFDRATVAMPAWHEVGLVGWANFSRHADLGNGQLVYPIMAIAGTAITLAAAVLLVAKSRKPRPGSAPMVVAATFALVSLPFSFKAAPYMLSLRYVADDDLRALQSAFSGYALWGRLQGICHLACFVALVWSIAILGPVAPTSEYATAVRLFERGELAAAVTALRSFMAQHGDDARAEDAGYLLVLTLHRSGDTSVREAARAYLERFPNGFRRAEVEQLAR